MMCDTNWCTFCDNAISPYSDSLYCSEDCLRQDALMHHPMLGYDYADLKGFPHTNQSKKSSLSASPESLPSPVKRNSSIPSLLFNSQQDFAHSQKVPSLSPSLSSSLSSLSSSPHPAATSDINSRPNSESFMSYSYFHPKPRRILPSSVPFMGQFNQTFVRS